MKWPTYTLIGIAVLSVVWGACESRSSNRAIATRDSALAVSAVQTKLALQEKQQKDSLERVANWALEASRETRRQADTVWATLPSNARPSDSLKVAVQVIALLRESLDSLSVAFTAQQQATAHLQTAYDFEKDRGDGLDAALRKMPIRCPRFLGLFPMPRIGPGVAVTTRGIAPAFAVIVPLGC